MRGIRCLLAALSVLSACTGQEAPRDTAVVSQEGGTGHCHINYHSVDRDIPCSQVANVMRSEMQIPTKARIVVAPDEVASVDEVDHLLKVLYKSGYMNVEFPSRR